MGGRDEAAARSAGQERLNCVWKLIFSVIVAAGPMIRSHNVVFQAEINEFNAIYLI